MTTYQDAQLNALGDPTRRAIITRLRNGPIAVGELARAFPISRPAVSQHLRILKEARLVKDQAAGNRRLYALDPSGFDSLRDYFDEFWNQALASFKATAEQHAQRRKDDVHND